MRSPIARWLTLPGLADRDERGARLGRKHPIIGTPPGGVKKRLCGVQEILYTPALTAVRGAGYTAAMAERRRASIQRQARVVRLLLWILFLVLAIWLVYYFFLIAPQRRLNLRPRRNPYGRREAPAVQTYPQMARSRLRRDRHGGPPKIWRA